MTTAIQDAMIWMNDTFGAKIDRKLKNSPISKELVIAICLGQSLQDLDA
jgi:hypothetical protein